ncbi:hypothetical protein ACQU0X_21425 [Pseudovibrio ascidiaceicola]|uniref:hypothetical protein n=1 Tax=Pseudovibrio ascidiaceicola TaxID=285279 RepID=UPI003D360609
MNISELLALAIQKAQLKNKRQLAAKLNIAEAHMGKYQKGHYLPSDETLFKLCRLAETDPAQWLLWARMQREEGEARQEWEKIAAIYVKETSTQVA